MITLAELIELCDTYSALGSAVQEQLKEVINGDDMANKNPNALRYASRFLREAASLDVQDASNLYEEMRAHLNHITLLEGRSK